MTPAPTLVVVREGGTPTGLPPVLGGFDVVQVEAADGSAGLVEAIRASGSPRWLLLGQGGGVEVVTRLATEVLSGQAPVFGLAGVVVLGASAGAGLPDLPLLVATEGGGLGEAVTRFWREHAGRGPTVPVDFGQLIASDRVSGRTRGIHARRALADDPNRRPVTLTETQLATLRVLAARVVPQEAAQSSIDLAARVDAQLADGQGDGWRHADLPPDPAAYARGLDSLGDLATLDPAEQDALLTELAAGERAGSDGLSGQQLALWFEDACTDLVRQWVAHPATMARIGYDALATGGEELVGFVRLGADERESWEPLMATGGTR